jgi:hypothetical protein
MRGDIILEYHCDCCVEDTWLWGKAKFRGTVRKPLQQLKGNMMLVTPR